MVGQDAWPGMYQQEQIYLRGCFICQKVALERKRPTREITSNGASSQTAVDIAGPLEVTCKTAVILVVNDYPT